MRQPTRRNRRSSHCRRSGTSTRPWTASRSGSAITTCTSARACRRRSSGRSTTPADFKIPLRTLDNWHSRYFVGLWQLALGVNQTPDLNEFGGLVRFDTGRISRKIKADWNGSGIVPDTDYEREEIEFEEAYLVYNVPIGNGLTLEGWQVRHPARRRGDRAVAQPDVVARLACSTSRSRSRTPAASPPTRSPTW